MIRLSAHSFLLAMAACFSVSACAAGSSQDYRPGVGVEVDGCRLSRNVSASTTYLYVDEMRVVARSTCLNQAHRVERLNGTSINFGATRPLFSFDLQRGLRQELPDVCGFDAIHAALRVRVPDFYLSVPAEGSAASGIVDYNVQENGDILARCNTGAQISRPDGEYKIFVFGMLRRTTSGWVDANQYGFVALPVAAPGTPPVVSGQNLGPTAASGMLAINTDGVAIFTRAALAGFEPAYHHLARVEPGELVFAEPVDWWPILDCPEDWRHLPERCRPQELMFSPSSGDMVVRDRWRADLTADTELLNARYTGSGFEFSWLMPTSDSHAGNIRSVSDEWILVDYYRRGFHPGDSAFVTTDRSRVITIEHPGGDDHNIVAGLASPDGRYGVVKRRDGRVMVFDLDQPDGTRLTHRDAIQSWRTSRYGQLVVSGDGRVSQFDGLELDYVGQIRGQ